MQANKLWGKEKREKKNPVFYAADPVPYMFIECVVIVEPDTDYMQQLSAAMENWPGTAKPCTSSYMRGARIDSEAGWQRQLSSFDLEMTTDKTRVVHDSSNLVLSGYQRGVSQGGQSQSHRRRPSIVGKRTISYS